MLKDNEDVSPESQKLSFLAYQKTQEDANATVYSRRGRPVSNPTLFNEDALKPQTKIEV